MTIAINTLEFAERFESAGFEHDKARALANAFASAQEVGRGNLVTKLYLDSRFAESDARLFKAMSEMKVRLTKVTLELEVHLTKQIGEIVNNSINRLWSRVAIIAGVSTAISATIGAAVALILHRGL